MNIDRIAREMVDVEPSVDLEARIRRRLNEARPNRTAAWWTWRVAAPLAAAGAIAIAFVVLGPGSRVQGPTSRIQSPATRVGAQASGAPSVVSSPVPQLPSSPVARVPTSTPSRAASLLTAEEIAWMGRRMPALDPVNALQMDHLRVTSIQPEPLAITPLIMTPVATEGGVIERRIDR